MAEIAAKLHAVQNKSLRFTPCEFFRSISIEIETENACELAPAFTEMTQILREYGYMITHRLNAKNMIIASFQKHSRITD